MLSLSRLKNKVQRAVINHLIQRRQYFRQPASRLLHLLRMQQWMLAHELPRRLLLTRDDPKYQQVLSSRSHRVNTASKLELHTLACEKDFLRTVWALKSFFLYSGLDPKLVIHNDGTLSQQSIATFRTHFIGCEMPENAAERAEAALARFPRCRFFRRKHFISGKLFDVMLFSDADYLMVMDTDILWFSPSPQIIRCTKEKWPFYVSSGAEAYVRNRRFMEAHCGLKPAENLNAGILGYPRSEFMDLDFIEHALDRLIDISPALVGESIGYTDLGVPGFDPDDPVHSIVWWVMEQTLYACLFGRSRNVVRLDVLARNGNQAHSFVNTSITPETALQHFISDEKWNAFFPVGVEYLIRNHFLDAWNHGQ